MFNKLVSGLNSMRVDILKVAAPLAILMLIVGALLIISGKWKQIGWFIVGTAIIGFIISLLAPDIIYWIGNLFGGSSI